MFADGTKVALQWTLAEQGCHPEYLGRLKDWNTLRNLTRTSAKCKVLILGMKSLCAKCAEARAYLAKKALVGGKLGRHGSAARTGQ